MPIVFYPPNMPLHDRYIFHRREMEDFWAAPIPFIPFTILATLLFMGGIWGVSAVRAHQIPASIDPVMASIVISLLPPLILVAVILIVPHLSSPVWPYQVAILHDPANRQLRWNLAVVAAAHIYCGHIAQTEWLSQMMGLTSEDRARALTYIKGVRSRLQQIPVLQWRDILLSVGAALLVLIVTMVAFPSQHLLKLEPVLNALVLAFILHIFMFYLFLQRWQHIRRLMELEEVFEELLPSRQMKNQEPLEDEVDRWYREQNEKWTPSTKPSSAEYPTAPWE